MGEIIGRAVSRKEALETLTGSKQYIPQDHIAAYVAALNRVRFELMRHEPVKQEEDGRCGNCGMWIPQSANYCLNCGKEIERQWRS